MNDKTWVAAWVAGTLVLSVPAWAQEAGGGMSPRAPKTGLAWSVDAGLGFTDNINITADNKESDVTLRAGGSIDYSARGARSGASLNGNLGWEEYSKTQVDSNLVGRMSGNAYFAFIPETFIWSVNDSFGQSRQNSLNTLTPENRENINYFSTGPTLNLRLGGSTSINMNATYGTTTYETSPFDNDVKQGTVAVMQRLSSLTVVSLNANAQRYEYKQRAFNSDYDIQAYYLQVSTVGRRTQLSFNVGLNQLHDFGRSENGTLYGVTLVRQLAPRSSLTLAASQNFSAAGNVFRQRGQDEAGGLDTALLISTSSPFEGRTYTVAWSAGGRRTDLTTTLSLQDEKYTRAPQLDRRAWYGSVNLTRRLRPTLTGRVYVDGFKEDFTVANRNQDEIRVGVGLGWNLSSRLSLALDAGHTRRKQALSGGTGNENRAVVSIVYSGGTAGGGGFPGRGLDPGGLDSVGGLGGGF